MTGDDLVVHEYGRLSALKADDTPFTGWTDLKKGDCIISFQVKQIHKLKEEINDFHNRDEEGNLVSKANHCAVIYGNLPPESKIE